MPGKTDGASLSPGVESLDMKDPLIILISILIFSMPINALGDDFEIKLSSPPTPTQISIELVFLFDQPKVIYHWSHGKSIYPILNSGLYIDCRELETKQKIAFMPLEKALPKMPHELDVLKAKEYKEMLKVVPSQNYNRSPLKKGKYSLKLIYDTKELREYPGAPSFLF